jgi:cytochrome c5
MAAGRSRRGILALTTALVWVWMAVTYQTAGSAAGQAPAQGSEQAQIEKGRQAVGQACAPCHGNILRVLQIHRKPAAEWRDTVYSMIGRGAQILPEEVEPLTAYLTATAGPRPASASASASQPSVKPAASSSANTALEAEATSILGRQCVRCHDLATATKKPAADDWNTVIARMATYGAEVGAADRQKLVEYLNSLAPAR